MSSNKHTKYVRRIDATGRTNGSGGSFVISGGGGPTPPPSGQSVAASDVTFAPAGNIQAVQVQGAIEELDAEKLGLVGGTMTGILILADMLPDQDHEAASKWYVDNLDHLLVPDAAGVPVVRLLGDFVRVGHPLQPGLTWTMAEGVRLPAVCVVGMLDRFTTFIANPTGGNIVVMGAVHYIAEPTRISTIAVSIDENTLADPATLLVVAAASMADLLGTEDAAQVGRVAVPTVDRDVVGAAEDFVIDADTGEVVTSGANRVVTGDDPLLPAGTWLGVWDGTNMDFLAGVTVTVLGRRV